MHRCHAPQDLEGMDEAALEAEIAKMEAAGAKASQELKLEAVASPPQAIATAPATVAGIQAAVAPGTPDNPKLTQELLQRLEKLESENERMKQGK